MKKRQGRWPEENKNPLAKIRGGLTIERAAVAMGITGRTLSRYENGMTDVPMKVADKMVHLYQVPIEVIYQAVKDTWGDGASTVIIER
jgi:DNA-binding XRE family transcriptional regulator